MRTEDRPVRVVGDDEAARLAATAGVEIVPDELPEGADAPTRRLFGIGSLVKETVTSYRFLAATKYGIVPLLVLTVVDFVQAFDNAILALVLPEIRRGFNVSLSTLTVLSSALGIVILLAGPVIGYVADRVRRTAMIGISAVLSGVFSVATGGAPNYWVLTAIRGVDEIGERVGDLPTQSLLADYYPVEARGKAYSLRSLALKLAAVAAPASVGWIAVNYGWRATFFVAGPPLILSGLYALLRLREPVRGYWERRRLGQDDETAAEPEPPIGWGEALRTIGGIRTLRRTMISTVLLVSSSSGFVLLFNFYLLEQFRLNPFERGLLTIPSSVAGMIAIIVGGTLTDRLVRHRPGRVLVITGLITALGGLSHVVIVLIPSLALVVVFGIAIAIAAGLVGPAQFTVSSLVLPARLRGQGLGILQLMLAPALLLTPVAGYLATEYGIRTAIMFYAPIYIAAALLQSSAGSFFESDMRAAVAAAAAFHEYKRAREAGETKLLVCRDVDVHYGSVQVLFNVDFDVEEGQTIALLGTNGAGKSTLLRAISGIQPASNGAIVYDGRDITHVPPHEIARLGIVHMPGGRGVFPGLSVRENLDLAVANLPDPESGRARLEQVFGYFPRLRERIDTEAGLLSGGEQQMVALGQAFVARPRLLVIDELSLGLSPVVVQQLLGIVRAMNEKGTTIILVEQSVNVALTVAERAIFMEKGEVRFAGPTADLLARPDIMRAVYLKGSAALTEAPPRAARAGGPAAERRTILEVEGLTRSFGGVKAVDGVSFTLADGEVLGLVGPNGAGKTTLFDLISGFIPVDAGTVVFDGVDITKMTPDARSKLRLIRRFQDARLFPSLTVFETISVALERKLEVRNTFVTALQIPAVRKGELRVRARAERLIEILELEAYRDKFISELSTGLRRVVDLACVIAAEPKVLLLDEPSSGIAQAEAESLGPLLRRVRFETGCSLLIIEHDMPLISAVSDELLGLVQGQVVTRGTPDEVLSHPVLVEAYLGSSEEALRRSGALPT